MMDGQVDKDRKVQDSGMESRPRTTDRLYLFGKVETEVSRPQAEFRLIIMS